MARDNYISSSPFSTISECHLLYEFDFRRQLLYGTSPATAQTSTVNGPSRFSLFMASRATKVKAPIMGGEFKSRKYFHVDKICVMVDDDFI